MRYMGLVLKRADHSPFPELCDAVQWRLVIKKNWGGANPSRSLPAHSWLSRLPILEHTLYTEHTLYIEHILYIQSTHYTQSAHTVHRAHNLYTEHTPYTEHTLYYIYYKLYTAHTVHSACTLYTEHCTLYSEHTLYTEHPLCTYTEHTLYFMVRAKSLIEFSAFYNGCPGRSVSMTTMQ